MKKRTVWYVAGVLIFGLALLAISCGGKTTAPAKEMAMTLESISVTPASASIEVGQTKSYTATGTYSDGMTADITAQVTWKSSNTVVATISSAGLATAVAAGTTTVTATLDTVSGTATLTVTTPPAKEQPAVTPTGPPAIPHTLEGRSDCLLCHAAGGLKPFPADHAGRTSATCTGCHQPK